MKKKSLSLSLIALLSATVYTAPLAAAPQQISPVCEVFSHTMIDRVVTLFHEKTLSEEQKRQALARLFNEAVDTDWIGKFVLGRYWKAGTPEEQKNYLQGFRNYLTHIYVSKFNDESGMSVDAIRIQAVSQTEDKDSLVKTVIQRKGEPEVHVDYILDPSSGKCQVHDIKVEGVSLIASQRSEIQTVAASGGMQAVIQALSGKDEGKDD